MEATGGTAPFSYGIDDCVTLVPSGLFEDLCPGDYNICVEDVNGCRYTNVLTIGVGMAPADATIVTLGPFCADDEPVDIIVTELRTAVYEIHTYGGVRGALRQLVLAEPSTRFVEEI